MTGVRGLCLALSIGALCAAGMQGSTGCGDDVSCEAALQKMKSCLDRLDCNDADPLDRRTCVSSKNSGEQAVQDLQGAPCVSDVADRAEQISRCEPDPSNYCRCP